MTRLHFSHLLGGLGLLALLAGCGGTPPPASWKMNAVGQLDQAQQRWLEGDTASAERALARMRGDIAPSGRLDLLARAELAACAARVASLEFAPCSGFERLAADAAEQDRAYARFLSGDWNGLETRQLPAHYAGLLGARDAVAAHRALTEIPTPLPRLIGAALLLRQARAEPATLALAMETASERGWRRPLLAWLQVSLKRAQSAGDTAAAAQIQRRIDLVLGGLQTPAQAQP